MKKEKEASATAKLVRHGAYQYVLLPKGYEFEGDYVEIERSHNGVVVKSLPKQGGSKGRKKAKP